MADVNGSSLENANRLKQDTFPKDESISKLLSTERYVKKSLDNFRLHSKLNFREIPEIRLTQLNIGKELGTGGFGLVKEVNWKGNTYAIKTLLPTVIQGNETDLKIGASDLLKEAAFLSAISHPNIVNIHAKHTIDVLDNFIVIDRLHESLSQRMVAWRKWDAKIHKNLNLRKKLQREGVEVCLGICDALLYLHNQNVVFRDLKMSNVGFDKGGNVKLFDFGIAKELKDDDKSNTGKYKLSGQTGSLAYMAPEVAKNWKYDKMVDVYSFGILLWEIAALRPAFPQYETPEQMKNVWNGDERPPTERWWHVELQWLMKKCWSYFAKSRPEFDVVKETLEEIIEDKDEKEEEEQNIRNVMSFRFGSRRSQKLSVDSTTGRHTQRSVSHNGGFFFGKLSLRSNSLTNDSDRSNSNQRLVFARSGDTNDSEKGDYNKRLVSTRSIDTNDSDRENFQQRIVLTRSVDTNDDSDRSDPQQKLSDDNNHHVRFGQQQPNVGNHHHKPDHHHHGPGKSILHHHSDEMPENISNTHNNNKRSQPQQQVKKPKREKKPNHGKFFFGLF
mmetsp:Transcript_39687/g.45206  ORF Transcript_39687/g.45206 Transcript_39687/m.45206 type:complete len:558 (-) Transcript_39687:135-1808(-)